jgi:protocatechuate 3,4-dioxygenase beta subunit
MTRRAAIVAGLGGVLAILVVWKFISSRPDSTGDDSDRAKASRSSASGRKHVDPKTLPKATIAGKVVREGGAPIARARVCARGDFDEWDQAPICTVASETGAYTISALVPASYAVSAVADTFRPSIYGVPGKHEIVLRPGEQKTGVDVILRSGGVELVGTVVDATGGAIAKALVFAEGSSWGGRDRPLVTSETDAQGRFRMWVAPSTTRVRASAQGYSSRSLTVEPPATIELALTPASSLAGTVVDANTNEPVAGVRVLAWELAYDDGGAAVTDDSGKFRIDGLTPGRYQVSARAETGLAVSAGSVLVGLAQDVDGVVLKLWPAYRIEGRVVVSTTKADCQGGSFTLHDTARDRYDHGRHRPDGVVAADGVLPGTYKVEADCPGFINRKSYPDITIIDRDVVGAVWEVDPGASLRGRVITKAGEPMDTGTVIARIKSEDNWASHNGWRNAAIGRNGAYELAGLVSGTYRISVTKNEDRDSFGGGGEDDGFEIEIPAGASMERDITVDDVGTIVGVVVDLTGRPQRGVQVSAMEGRKFERATSDVTGRFRIEAKAGEYHVVAHSGLYDETSVAEDKKRGKRVVVASGRTVEVRLVVKARAGVITGSVLDVDGKPVSDAYVYAAPTGASGGERRSWDGGDPPTLTSVDGAFRLEGLAAATYSVHAYRKGGGQADTDNVAVGSNTTLRMKRTASIVGLARHAGKPIVDLAIEVEYPRTWFRRGEQFYRTDGRFTLRDLPAGHLQLVAMADGLRASMELDIAEGEIKTITVDVASPVTVTGRVVDLGTTTPVGGVEVVAKLADAVATFTTDTDPRGITDASGRFTIANVPWETSS